MINNVKTVLVAEDEMVCATFVTHVLECEGINVIWAKSGSEAVKKFKENEDEIDLLIFDVLMPDLNGKDAYEAIRKTMKEVPVIFVSGYSCDFLHDEFLLDINGMLLSKPIHPQDVLNAIKEISNEQIAK